MPETSTLKEIESERYFSKPSIAKSEDHIIYNVFDTRGVYYIPPYQRNYEWKEKQCDEFFNDILNLYHHDVSSDKYDGSHYIGSIYYYTRNKDELILVDGQQRLTSIILLLCAIRDFVKEKAGKSVPMDEKQKAALKKFIKEVDSLIINPEKSGKDLRIKLKQISKDDSSFTAIVCQEKVIKSSNTNIVKNYNYFKKNVEQYI